MREDGALQMIDNLLRPMTFGTALGCGLMAGLFFTFSVFVMDALGRLPAPQGIAAMQSINIAIVRPLFLLVFLGTAAGCVVLAAFSAWRWGEPGAGYRLAGSLLYLVGVMLVTFVCNIPRNNALAAVDPASAGAAGLWADYLRTWTAWNHVRTVAALAATAALIRAVR